MINVSGKNWAGSLLFNKRPRAHGRVNGYSWCFQSTTDSWLVEISEDQTIEPNKLPLVGYGCGGWLYEGNKVKLPDNEGDFIPFLNENLSLIFAMFNQNKMSYIPAVSCTCSE